MLTTDAHRLDRPPAIGRAVRGVDTLTPWSCRSAIVAGLQGTFGPMHTAHANGTKYRRPRRKWM